MLVFVFTLIGGALGMLLPDGDVGRFVGGAACGALAAWLVRLHARLGRLERRLGGAQHGTMRDGREHDVAHVRAEHARRDGRRATTTSADAAAAVLASEATSSSTAERDASRTAAPAPADAAERKRSRLVEDTEPSVIERGFAALSRWFTSGNVPVKVGVLLSVFGVGFLVKEAIDRNWIQIPIELRLAFVALFALVLLVLGWRLRDRNPTYAVSVQGGGVAMLYVTIYAAFAVYDLLAPGAAFTLLLAVTVAGAGLAVVQDARALAVLGIIGGFLAPLLTSTDSANHVALFSYYAVLDLAIFGIAWFRAWRELNLLGFFFTFGIASLWGIDAYRPELFQSTEPFLVLFVLLYIAIPVLFATRNRPELKGFVDGTLVFGTPLVAFALQAQLVGDTRYGLAISALALAAVYFAIAWRLLAARRPDLRVLAEAELGLGAAFLALAVPLALDARWTSAAWALQGAAMTWLGVRQQRALPVGAGALLQIAAGVALAAYGIDVWLPEQGVHGGTALGALMIALAGGFSSRCLDRYPFERLAARADGAAAAYLVWGAVWWLTAGLLEIDRHVPARFEPDLAMMFVALTALAATFVAPRLEWPRLNAVGFLAAGAIVLVALFSPLSHPHPLGRLGWAAWPLLLGAHYVFLRLRERHFDDKVYRAAHVASYWAIAWLLALEAGWITERAANGVWPAAAMLAAVAVLVLLTLRMRERIAWPLAAHRETYVIHACGGVLAMLVAVTLATSVISAGDPEPLPYIPIANPLELAIAVAVFAAWRGWQAIGEIEPRLAARREHGGLAFAALGLVLVTTAVARAVHHLGGVPFTVEGLAESTVLQAALSIVWGIAALGGMLLGARSKRRTAWIAGAALMAIVVVKLFVVELGNTGTVGRVVSFIGVGMLLLVVGYFAPAPPRTGLERQSA